jgi:putative PIN family toxin of toxin-antitoxin system
LEPHVSARSVDAHVRSRLADCEKVIEVVLDTNVLVAAVRSNIGASYRLLQTLEQQRWQPVISPALAFEYEAVLKRGLAEKGLTLQDIDDFLEYLCSRSKLVQIYFRWRPVLRDPDDDRILELGVRA